nr:DUF5681 domain-containing protein [Roseomonas rosulenta]
MGAYAVGYGRPPAHGQFRPGQSGNPHGRPKGAASLTSLIMKAMNEKVVVHEGGRRRKITKGEAIAKQMVNRAASGDLRAMQMLQNVERLQLMVAQAAERSATPEPEIPQPQYPQIDFSKLSTRQLKVLQEAPEIIQGDQEPPQDLPMPPPAPGEEPR